MIFAPPVISILGTDCNSQYTGVLQRRFNGYAVGLWRSQGLVCGSDQLLYGIVLPQDLSYCGHMTLAGGRTSTASGAGQGPCLTLDLGLVSGCHPTWGQFSSQQFLRPGMEELVRADVTLAACTLSEPDLAMLERRSTETTPVRADAWPCFRHRLFSPRKQHVRGRTRHDISLISAEEQIPASISEQQLSILVMFSLVKRRSGASMKPLPPCDSTRRPWMRGSSYGYNSAAVFRTCSPEPFDPSPGRPRRSIGPSGFRC